MNLLRHYHTCATQYTHLKMITLKWSKTANTLVHKVMESMDIGEIHRNKRIYKDVYVHAGTASWGVSTLRCHTHGAKGNTKLQNATFEYTVR